LRLASCVSVKRFDQSRRRHFVEQTHVLVLEHAALRVEILTRCDALIIHANQRGNELATVALQPRFEIPVHAGAERASFFLALDDEPDSDTLDAAGAQAGLDLLPEHR
jgi:hypothetical protein